MYESELKIMSTLWACGDMRAKEICNITSEKYGWHMNTTYTIIRKCVDKGYVKRHEPGFWCSANISLSEVSTGTISELISRFFEGSSKNFLASYIDKETELNKQEIRELIEILAEKERALKADI